MPDFYQQGGNATLISDYGNDLLPSINRDVVNFVGHYEFSPAATLFAEAKYANTQSYSLGQPSFDYYLLMQPDNPICPPARWRQIRRPPLRASATIRIPRRWKRAKFS